MVRRLTCLICIVLIFSAGCQPAFVPSAVRSRVRQYEEENLRLAQSRAERDGHLGAANDLRGVLLLADMRLDDDDLSAESQLSGRRSAGAAGIVRGPAYPGDMWRTFLHDLKHLPRAMWEDTTYTFADAGNLLVLTAAGGASIAIRASHVDGRFSDHFRDHRGLNDCWDNTFDAVGNPGTHFALAGAGYFLSQALEDVKGYETSKTLFNALVINGVTTLLIKVAAHTESPNGEEFGFPSGHTSSTFTLAAVLDEAYGPLVGVPMYLIAAMVGYERVQARNHDFSDVVFGAVLGIVVGKSVATRHRPKIFGMDVVPMIDPESGMGGLALVKQW